MAVATDDFNRTGTGLGANWTQPSSAGNQFDTDGTKAVPHSFSSSDSWDVYTATSFGSNQYSQAKLTVNGTTAGQAGLGLLVRTGVTVKNGYWFVIDHAGSNNYDIARIVSNALTDLKQGTLTWSDGDTFYFEATGSNPVVLTVKRNGVVVDTFSDSDAGRIASGGQPGIVFSTAETSASLDDWEGGDIPVGGGDLSAVVGGQIGSGASPISA